MAIDIGKEVIWVRGGQWLSATTGPQSSGATGLAGPIGPPGSTFYAGSPGHYAGSPGQRYMTVMANAQSASVQAIGFAAGASVGAPDNPVNADDSDSLWVRLRTSGLAAANVNTGFSFNGVRRSWSPEFYSRIKTGPPWPAPTEPTRWRKPARTTTPRIRHAGDGCAVS